MKKKNNSSSKVSGRSGGRKLKRAMRSDRGLNRSGLLSTIMELFRNRPADVFNYKQVSYEIGVSTMPQKQLVASILEELHIEDQLRQVDRGRYKLNSMGTVAVGIFERRSNGRNSFRIEGQEGGSIFVAERNSGHAMDGDKVRVQIHAKRRGREPEGEVIEILEQSKRTVVGQIKISSSYSFLVTEDRTLLHDIFIPKDKIGGASDGDKAVARIVEWPEGAKNPIGEVIAVLGKAGENDTEMNAILADFGLPYVYPEEVQAAANQLGEGLDAGEISQREDFRDVLTLTIDPVDAKDFDDALSFRKLPDGTYEVGVHIADVSYYVHPDDIIDQEAYSRATSIYLVDRTIPMLPERLSNDLCSLKPEVDRFAYSCVFIMNAQADVQDYRIVRAVIRSDRRFAYEEAQQVIETGEGDCAEAILKLNEFAAILRRRRFEAGAIAFESTEVRFQLDDKGHPLGVMIKESKDANKLIEEFMLLANRTVAAHIALPFKSNAKERVFVYRIHDQPNPDKLANLGEFVRRFGLKLKTSGSNLDVSKSINKLFEGVKGKPEQNLIETIAVRSMSRAIYSTDNIGHYGLAFDYYAHFTSPIRRYPDLMVHRLLTAYMRGAPSVDKDEYEDKCEHCSAMEQLASSAERSSIKYKQVEYLSSRLGQVFDGVISGVAEWGLYVELNENHCEGLVPIRHLDDDYYEYDEKNYCLVGRRRNGRYSLGDAITIRVAGANLERKQLDFEPML